MREIVGDLWEQFGQPGHRIAISTNGTIKRNGAAVMGRGCALQATKRFPGVDKLLGKQLKLRGNLPGYLLMEPTGNPANDRLMILPVKHNWWEVADIELVIRSTVYLAYEAAAWPDWTFHVPRLGCGNGKLNWRETVLPRMIVLPDNVVVHT